MVRAVLVAVDFIRWTSALRHFGVDVGGSGGAATLWDLARPHHPVLARAAGVCESPIYRLTWSQSCAHDLPMSWLNQLKHRLGMPKPPPAVCRARAFDLLWLRHALSGDPRMMARFTTTAMETAYVDQTRSLTHRRRAYPQARLRTVDDRPQAT